MYKAIQEIGGYKVGEDVPTDKAEIWSKMYSVSPVEKVGDKEVLLQQEKDESELENKLSNDVMFDDYLSRNTNVVKKNIKKDNLSQKQLKGLLELEDSDKKREVIIDAIKEKLKN